MNTDYIAQKGPLLCSIIDPKLGIKKAPTNMHTHMWQREHLEALGVIFSR
jgi:hypothetical protein